jgi:hypothetical protein
MVVGSLPTATPKWTSHRDTAPTIIPEKTPATGLIFWLWTVREGMICSCRKIEKKQKLKIFFRKKCMMDQSRLKWKWEKIASLVQKGKSKIDPSNKSITTRKLNGLVVDTTRSQAALCSLITVLWIMLGRLILKMMFFSLQKLSRSENLFLGEDEAMECTILGVKILIIRKRISIRLIMDTISTIQAYHSMIIIIRLLRILPLSEHMLKWINITQTKGPAYLTCRPKFSTNQHHSLNSRRSMTRFPS